MAVQEINIAIEISPIMQAESQPYRFLRSSVCDILDHICDIRNKDVVAVQTSSWLLCSTIFYNLCTVKQ